MNNPTYDFKDQVALVTGAGSGMGLVTAQAFAEAGAAVVLADIDEGAARAATDALTAAGGMRQSASPAMWRMKRSRRDGPARLPLTVG